MIMKSFKAAGLWGYVFECSRDEDGKLIVKRLGETKET